ncbi:uncharacterized protein LOC110864860 [Helianthus annuus]|uniref:uncharacterized protein LOC110864860 n=1 Tax=Helianthus annuus TaxID=4232 RepID=UPI0016530996|nr:uncharacterized protein LOC110864860 [Helianthus annuus]
MIFWRPAREDDGGGGFVSPDSFTWYYFEDERLKGTDGALICVVVSSSGQVKDQDQPRFRSFGSPMGLFGSDLVKPWMVSFGSKSVGSGRIQRCLGQALNFWVLVDSVKHSRGLTSWTSVCSQYIHATRCFMICPRISSNHNIINYS